MPKTVKWALWAVAAVLLYRVLSTDPHGAGHAVHQFISGLWAFLGAL